MIYYLCCGAVSPGLFATVMSLVLLPFCLLVYVWSVEHCALCARDKFPYRDIKLYLSHLHNSSSWTRRHFLLVSRHLLCVLRQLAATLPACVPTSVSKSFVEDYL